jgi:thiol-disulfide isomerase/thioredoxin
MIKRLLTITALITFQICNLNAADNKLQEKYKTLVNANLVDRNGKKVLPQIGEKAYTILYFFAAYCPPCRAFTPKLKAFYDKYHKDKNFNIVLINRDFKESKMYEYIKAQKLEWGTFYNKKSSKEILASFGLKNFPTLVILNKNGDVVGPAVDAEGNRISHKRVLNTFAIEKLGLEEFKETNKKKKGK